MIIFSVISGLRAVLKPEEQAHGPLHGRKGHQRIQTGAAGTLVEDAQIELIPAAVRFFYPKGLTYHAKNSQSGHKFAEITP